MMTGWWKVYHLFLPSEKLLKDLWPKHSIICITEIRQQYTMKLGETHQRPNTYCTSTEALSFEKGDKALIIWTVILMDKWFFCCFFSPLLHRTFYQIYLIMTKLKIQVSFLWPSKRASSSSFAHDPLRSIFKILNVKNISGSFFQTKRLWQKVKRSTLGR